MSEQIAITRANDNIFADLGFDNPEEMRMKAQLGRELRAAIKRRRLTQTRAAILMGLKQPDVSAIINGKIAKFSLDRLMRCLDGLGYQIEMKVSLKRRERTTALPAE